MKKTDWKDIAELVGIAAIVASLVFVGLQMRQDQAIARADLGSRTAEIQIGIKEILTSAEFARVWTKMLNQPDELTAEERGRVDSFLDLVQESFLRECYLVLVGVFGGCEMIVRHHAPMYFGNSYAQDWWRRNPLVGVSEEVNEYIEDVITNATQ